jgi:hypothetical protein
MTLKPILYGRLRAENIPVHVWIISTKIVLDAA